MSPERERERASKKANISEKTARERSRRDDGDRRAAAMKGGRDRANAKDQELTIKSQKLHCRARANAKEPGLTLPGQS